MGYGSTESERDLDVQKRRKRKAKIPRRIGVPPDTVGEQSDAKAIFASNRAKRLVAETIDTLECQNLKPGEPGNHLVLVQFNCVEDSKPNGGEFTHRARATPKLTILASSRDVAVKVFKAIGSTVGRNNPTCEVEWLIGKADQESLLATITDATQRRQRPKKKTKTSQDTQNDEDPANYETVSPGHS